MLTTTKTAPTRVQLIAAASNKASKVAKAVSSMLLKKNSPLWADSNQLTDRDIHTTERAKVN